jgi:pimeloyl-ACP methyl ester carboxylesterase
LLQKLSKVLFEIDQLETIAKPLLENTSGSFQHASPAIVMAANSVGIVASELRDFVESLKPVAKDSAAADSDDEGDPGMDTVRRRFEEQSSSLMEAAKSGLSSIPPMLDPPLQTSIFGFDVLRGCMLSRYRGARQLWVKRQSGGMIDVIHIPGKSTNGSSSRQGKRAVMYCNPNAGLIEVAAGMGLSGGNVDPESEGGSTENSWSDFYTNLGFDVYLFNYAGFGRSYGAGYCGVGKRGGEEPYVHGVVGRIQRILHSTFCGFQPTPDTLREDGLAVASHIISDLGVETLVIHGESIGGVAASATAKHLSQSAFSRDRLALLICDRTFCNLEAVAQRLVGGWSGYAIRALAPLWSTDVVNDFIAAACPKVVANDSADSIIFDSASLKAGIAFWKEIYRGAASTKGIGWMMEVPMHYRMAVDYENVSVNGELLKLRYHFLFCGNPV